jgi:hypothetical protein
MPKKKAVTEFTFARPPFCYACGTQQPPRRRTAFTAIPFGEKDMRAYGYPDPVSGWIISMCREGEKGHNPFVFGGSFVLEKDARQKAKILNRHLGWASEVEAQTMVLSTIPAKEGQMADLLRTGINLFRGLLDGAPDTTIQGWMQEARAYAKEAK